MSSDLVVKTVSSISFRCPRSRCRGGHSANCELSAIEIIDGHEAWLAEGEPEISDIGAYLPSESVRREVVARYVPGGFADGPLCTL